MENTYKIKTTERNSEGKFVEVERDPTPEELEQFQFILENEKKKRDELYNAMKNIKNSKQ